MDMGCLGPSPSLRAVTASGGHEIPGVGFGFRSSIRLASGTASQLSILSVPRQLGMIGIPSRGESGGRWEVLTTLPAVRSLSKSRSCLWSEREGACRLSARCWDHNDEEKGDFLGGSSSEERLALMWLCGDGGDTLVGLSRSKGTGVPRELVSPGCWYPQGIGAPQGFGTFQGFVTPRELVPYRESAPSGR